MKKNEVRRTINSEKNNIWDNKCTEINTYIGRRCNTETWIIKSITERRETMLASIISHKEWMDITTGNYVQRKDLNTE